MTTPMTLTIYRVCARDALGYYVDLPNRPPFCYGGSFCDGWSHLAATEGRCPDNNLMEVSVGYGRI